MHNLIGKTKEIKNLLKSRDEALEFWEGQVDLSKVTHPHKHHRK